MLSAVCIRGCSYGISLRDVHNNMYSSSYNLFLVYDEFSGTYC